MRLLSPSREENRLVIGTDFGTTEPSQAYAILSHTWDSSEPMALTVGIGDIVTCIQHASWLYDAMSWNINRASDECRALHSELEGLSGQVARLQAHIDRCDEAGSMISAGKFLPELEKTIEDLQDCLEQGISKVKDKNFAITWNHKIKLRGSGHDQPDAELLAGMAFGTMSIKVRTHFESLRVVINALEGTTRGNDDGAGIPIQMTAAHGVGGLTPHPDALRNFSNVANMPYELPALPAKTDHVVQSHRSCESSYNVDDYVVGWLVPTAIEIDACSIFKFDYDARLQQAGTDYDTHVYAKRLAGELIETCNDPPSIWMIGHSLGGICVRSLLTKCSLDDQHYDEMKRYARDESTKYNRLNIPIGIKIAFIDSGQDDQWMESSTMKNKRWTKNKMLSQTSRFACSYHNSLAHTPFRTVSKAIHHECRHKAVDCHHGGDHARDHAENDTKNADHYWKRRRWCPQIHSLDGCLSLKGVEANVSYVGRSDAESLYPSVHRHEHSFFHAGSVFDVLSPASWVFQLVSVFQLITAALQWKLGQFHQQQASDILHHKSPNKHDRTRPLGQNVDCY